MATPVIPRNDTELEEMFTDKNVLTEVFASADTSQRSASSGTTVRSPHDTSGPEDVPSSVL